MLCVTGNNQCRAFIGGSATPGPELFKDYILPIGTPILFTLDLGYFPVNEHEFQLPLQIPMDWGIIGLDLYWTAAQGRVAAGEPPTGSGLEVDFAVDWGGEWHGMPVSAFMKANNLLDRDLRRHVSPLKEYVPLPGRGVAAGLRLWF